MKCKHQRCQFHELYHQSSFSFTFWKFYLYISCTVNNSCCSENWLCLFCCLFMCLKGKAPETVRDRDKDIRRSIWWSAPQMFTTVRAETAEIRSHCQQLLPCLVCELHMPKHLGRPPLVFPGTWNQSRTGAAKKWLVPVLDLYVLNISRMHCVTTLAHYANVWNHFYSFIFFLLFLVLFMSYIRIHCWIRSHQLSPLHFLPKLL